MVINNRDWLFQLVIMQGISFATTELSGRICSQRLFVDINDTLTDVFIFYSTSSLRELRLRLAGLNTRDDARRGKSKLH